MQQQFASCTIVITPPGSTNRSGDPLKSSPFWNFAVFFEGAVGNKHQQIIPCISKNKMYIHIHIQYLYLYIYTYIYVSSHLLWFFHGNPAISATEKLPGEWRPQSPIGCPENQRSTSRLENAGPRYRSHRIHGNGILTYMETMGKYTDPMDPMGMSDSHSVVHDIMLKRKIDGLYGNDVQVDQFDIHGVERWEFIFFMRKWKPIQ